MEHSQKKLLIIGYVWPEPDSSAAGRRMMQLISLFRSNKWDITFASSAAESRYMADLESMGIDTVGIEINSRSFDEFISRLQPAIVMFDRFVVEEQFGWRVAEVCPGALRMLDTEDLHCLRKKRREAVEEGRTFRKTDLLSDDTAKREVAAIWRSDVSLIISEAECAILRNLFDVDSSLMHYLPFLSERLDKETADNWPDFESRRHFITVGNFRHAPNRDAVVFLKREIWPLIRSELPEAEVHIYGAYPSGRIQELNNAGEGFCIKGRAGHIEKRVRQARVSLVPLRYGAGLKGKLFEAMQCGTPSVTTTIGSEGIAGELPWSGIIADKAEEIASAAVKLHSDRSAWMNASRNGIRIINSRFSKDRFESALIDRITDLMSDLEDHRRNNFTGSMLRHHTTASTRYMAKWIEEKNS